MDQVLRHRVALVHLLFVAPFLVYVAALQPVAQWVYWATMALGVLVFLRFSVEAVMKQPFGNRHIFYLSHALIFAPLLIYVGYMGVATPQPIFTLLLAIAITAIAYHGIRFIQRIFFTQNKV